MSLASLLKDPPPTYAFELSEEGIAAARLELTSDRPVFPRDKGVDLLFALTNQPQRNRLHSPCGQTVIDRLPDKGTYFIAEDSIHHTARLL